MLLVHISFHRAAITVGKLTSFLSTIQVVKLKAKLFLHAKINRDAIITDIHEPKNRQVLVDHPFKSIISSSYGELQVRQDKLENEMVFNHRLFCSMWSVIISTFLLLM